MSSGPLHQPRHTQRLRHLCRTATCGASGTMATKAPRRVGLLGIGAIGSTVARALLRPAALLGMPPTGEAPEPDGVEGAALCAVLVSDTAKHDAKRAWLPEGVLLTDSVVEFLAAAPEVVVEAAGQPTVIDYGELVLRAGADFVVTSTGALTDDVLHARLKAAACEAGSGRLHLASGAMPGLDWMQAAAMGGGGGRDVTVTVVQSKPPASWVGTVAEPAVAAVEDWEAHGPLTIFEGVAREAAAAFPKSSNVTATLALATVGLDATNVRLVADPQPHFSTSLELQSAAGTIRIQAEHLPSATNPKTSSDVSSSTTDHTSNPPVSCGVYISFGRLVVSAGGALGAALAASDLLARVCRHLERAGAIAR